MIYDKESDERYQISKFDEDLFWRYRNLGGAKIDFTETNIYPEKEFDEINPIDMNDNKDTDEREHVSKNDEVNISDGIEDLKVVKLSSHKYVGNVETESVDMSDDNYSTERYDISKYDGETLTDVDEYSEE